MINLLPTEDKRQIKAARHNTVLVKYVSLLSLVLLLTLASFGGGYYVAERTKALAQQALRGEESNASKYAKAKADADAFAKDLATAKSVFSEGITYSQLLLDIAEVVPKGSVINGLNLTGNAFGSSLNITGKATSLDVVEKLKEELENSTVFEGVSTVSVSTIETTDTEEGGANQDYGYNVTLKATLSKPEAAKETN